MATFHAYRDALRSMEDMLARNPQPEEMAVALSDDFAKRRNDDYLNPPRSAGELGVLLLSTTQAPLTAGLFVRRDALPTDPMLTRPLRTRRVQAVVVLP